MFFPRENPGTDYTVNHVGGKMSFYMGLWPFLFGFFVEPSSLLKKLFQSLIRLGR